MSQISRPTLYGILVLIAATGIWYFGSAPDAGAAIKAAAKKPRPKEIQSDFVVADFDTRFDKPKASARNLFMPLVVVSSESKPTSGKPKDLYKIPAPAAGGEGDWIFTGYAEVDGAVLGLLENSSKHQSGMVKVGQKWKGSTVARITRESITLKDKDGNDQTVLRYDPLAVQKQEKPANADVGNEPVKIAPNLQGPIGPGPAGQNIRIRPAPMNQPQIIVGEPSQ